MILICFLFFSYKKDIVDLDFVSKVIEEEFLIYLKLSILLYGDETVIMAEYAYDLQHALIELHEMLKKKYFFKGSIAEE